MEVSVIAVVKVLALFCARFAFDLITDNGDQSWAKLQCGHQFHFETSYKACPLSTYSNSLFPSQVLDKMVADNTLLFYLLQGQFVQRSDILLEALFWIKLELFWRQKKKAERASSSMLDSCNFVIYGNESQVIWDSFDSPTGWYNPPVSYLRVDHRSSSCRLVMSGQFYLDVDDDGLAAYPVNHTGIPEECYWKLTAGNETLQTIANSSYPADSKTVICRATLDLDGILRLYSHRFEISGNSNVTTKSSAKLKQCKVTGFCGFNSFYSSPGGIANYYCFPGFKYINPGVRNLGCYKSFNEEEGCERNEPEVFHNITGIENTMLGGFPYPLLPVNKEDCKESCLSDCYCAAALYLDRTCGKLKLPLMLGMEDKNISAIVFITILTASLGFMAFMCLLIAISSFFVYKHRVSRYRELCENSNFGLTKEFSLQSFSNNELELATNGFEEVLGRGCLGAVYKRAICEGNKTVAVK
ncbi:G-type lectin S-receptor-like serine/threonine-protein kinase LECRK1 [Pistacia vera]|uniref:G-type lectin S-receptor-like serine/threonine-protein kinase LECRK1 n=1 Tax=Pistacia vera TaxID=55513 RepID=UPI001262C38A|nr:G-type lectin S-receptor-like serine/threonine-protein kinase LECRK1 [Pistacia vera]